MAPCSDPRPSRSRSACRAGAELLEGCVSGAKYVLRGVRDGMSQGADREELPQPLRRRPREERAIDGSPSRKGPSRRRSRSSSSPGLRGARLRDGGAHPRGRRGRGTGRASASSTNTSSSPGAPARRVRGTQRWRSRPATRGSSGRCTTRSSRTGTTSRGRTSIATRRASGLDVAKLHAADMQSQATTDLHRARQRSSARESHSGCRGRRRSSSTGASTTRTRTSTTG